MDLVIGESGVKRRERGLSGFQSAPLNQKPFRIPLNRLDSANCDSIQRDSEASGTPPVTLLWCRSARKKFNSSASEIFASLSFL
jgi:hypothetical protein